MEAGTRRFFAKLSDEPIISNEAALQLRVSVVCLSVWMVLDD